MTAVGDVAIPEAWETFDDAVDAALTALARDVRSRVSSVAPDADAVRGALVDFHARWEALEEEWESVEVTSRETEEVVGAFVSALAAAAGLDPEETWEDVSLGLVGAPILTEKDFLARIASLEEKDAAEAARIVAAAVEAIARELETTDRADASPLGELALRRLPGRQGRNPQTGEEIVVPPAIAVTFRAKPRSSVAAASHEQRALVFDTVAALLASGRRAVAVPGLGRFVERTLAAGVRRNPQTGEKIRMHARTLRIFRASPALRNRVAGGAG